MLPVPFLLFFAPPAQTADTHERLGKTYEAKGDLERAAGEYAPDGLSIAPKLDDPVGFLPEHPLWRVGTLGPRATADCSLLIGLRAIEGHTGQLDPWRRGVSLLLRLVPGLFFAP